MTTILQDELLQQITAHPHYGLLLITALEKCKLACDIIKREESSQKKKIKTCTVQGLSCGNGVGLMSLSPFLFLYGF